MKMVGRSPAGQGGGVMFDCSNPLAPCWCTAPPLLACPACPPVRTQGLGEDLQQHPLVVSVHQDTQLLGPCQLLGGEGIAHLRPAGCVHLREREPTYVCAESIRVNLIPNLTTKAKASPTCRCHHQLSIGTHITLHQYQRSLIGTPSQSLS